MSIARVRVSTKSSGQGVSSLSNTITNPTVGNALLVYIWKWTNTNPQAFGSSACTDNQGNTYTLIGQKAIGSGAEVRVALYLCAQVATSSGTFTVTVGSLHSSAYPVMAVAEYSASRGNGLALDKFASNSVASNTPPSKWVNTGATTRTTYDNELVAICHVSTQTKSTITVDANYSPGWTQELEELSFATATPGEGDSRIISVAQKAYGNWVVSTNGDYAAVVATFYEPGDTAAAARSGTIIIRDVQSASKIGSTMALPAFIEDPQAGDTIIVIAASIAQNPTAPSDSAGNTYTQIGSTLAQGNNKIAMWRAFNITGGSTFVVTTNYAGSTWVAAVAWCIAGLTTSPYNSDFTSSTPGSTAAGTLTTGTSSPAPSGASIFIGGITDGVQDNVTDGSGWNAIDPSGCGFDEGMQRRASFTKYNETDDCETEYKLSSSATAATWTSAATSSPAMLVASFAQSVTSADAGFFQYRNREGHNTRARR